MGRKFLISVCDIDRRRFGRDKVFVKFPNGTEISGKLIRVYPDAWGDDYGLEIEGVPMLQVSYGLVVEVEEAERPGDSKENPIILNHDNFKEEYIGKWCRWDDRPRYSIAKLRSRSVIVETWSEGLLKETTTYSFIGADTDPRSFIRSLKAT